ncbi:MAG: hypothetical protein BGO67_06675 [Alphaproteobacteria bacterium 41-28]|nr:MAG: hypothetical protein BGO67_06675 [Alphaproteobacteria bacterium 41-28]
MKNSKFFLILSMSMISILPLIAESYADKTVSFYASFDAWNTKDFGEFLLIRLPKLGPTDYNFTPKVGGYPRVGNLSFESLKDGQPIKYVINSKSYNRFKSTEVSCDGAIQKTTKTRFWHKNLKSVTLSFKRNSTPADQEGPWFTCTFAQNYD